MNTELLTFVRLHQGSYVTAPGGLGKQCVDLVVLWALALGKARPWGNAADLGRMANPAEWTWVDNTPLGIPEPGAIVVWHQYQPLSITKFGHTAVAVAASANVLLSLDQNWPDGAPTGLVLHEYGGVAGWLLPR